jgi:Gnt-I system high-affinity gluconate transporter
VAGPIFGKTLKNFKTSVDTHKYEIEGKVLNPPSVFDSFFVALLPVFLLTFFAIIKNEYSNIPVIQLIAEPYISMMIAVLVAVWMLVIKQGGDLKTGNKHIEEAFKGVSYILLIIAGSGALKQIMIDSGTSKTIGDILSTFKANPLITGWFIAAVLRVCIGSATVAGLTAAGIISNLVSDNPEVSKELMVLAVGSGSLMFSHINDGGFWLFKEYFNLTIKETIRTWSVMETIVSIMGLMGVLLLDNFV